MEETDPESPVLAEMKAEGYINVDYEKLVEYILEFSNGEEGTWLITGRIGPDCPGCPDNIDILFSEIETA